MTDKELLLAISSMMDTKLKPINARIDALEKNLNARIDAVEKNLNARIDAVESRINAVESRIDAVEANLNARIDAVESRIDAVEMNLNARIDRTNQLLENQVLPRLNEIETCYLSTYERYQQGVEKIEQLQLDVEVIKDVLIEHGERFQLYQRKTIVTV